MIILRDKSFSTTNKIRKSIKTAKKIINQPVKKAAKKGSKRGSKKYIPLDLEKRDMPVFKGLSKKQVLKLFL